MINKKSIQFITLVFIMILEISCSATRSTSLKFAIVSDLHAPDVPAGKKNMEAVVEAANKENVDFIIQLGDFIRLDSTSAPLMTIWDRFKGEKYHVLGNHDLDKYSKEEFIKGFNMPGRYYSFDKGDFHFIILDGNNLFDGKQYTPYNKANFYVDQKKRAFMDKEQQEWLKKDLASTNKRCILFSHQSIDRAMNNGYDVRDILEAENKSVGFKKVILAFSGHNHSNYTDEINGIFYVQINSASYVWTDVDTQTEKRYSPDTNKQYPLLKYSVTFDKPLYGIVTLNKKEISMKGTEAKFLPPTPTEVGLPNKLGSFPLVPYIKDFKINIH